MLLFNAPWQLKVAAAVAVPTIVAVPVDWFRKPAHPLALPPVELPVIVIVPVDALFAPMLSAPLPPVMLPVIVTVPVELLLTAKDVAPLPPEQLPVMFTVPPPLLRIPSADETVPPVMLPTMLATAGLAAVNCKHWRLVVVDLFVTFAVNVTPSASVKIPVPALLTSSQVVFTSMVIVWPLLARASSPVVGTTPPVHVAPAEKLPVAVLVMRAIT